MTVVGVVASAFLAAAVSYIPEKGQAVGGYEELTEDTTWSGERTVSGVVNVPKGKTLTVAKGATITFAPGAMLEVAGTLNIRGTTSEPISLRRDPNGGATATFFISAYDTGAIDVRNATISGGGSWQDIQMVRRHLFKSAYAFIKYRGAFSVYNSATFSADAVSFTDATVAVHIDRSTSDAKGVRVSRSRFKDNRYDVVNESDGTPAYDARYNWWGSDTGPDQTKIIGKLNTSDFATAESVRDPVIVVPGILGSYFATYSDDVEPEWKLDPIFHRYDDLVSGLEADGYEDGKTLIRFGYNWRLSNVENAKLLKEKIAAVRAERKWPKVDIVAHSMGGLLAREYIQSSGYADDVDQLITLGTPHLGAPEAYLRWEGAKFERFDSIIARYVFYKWAQFEGFDGIFDYLHNKPILGAKELLPIYDYLFRKQEDGYLATKYFDNYPRNEFLEVLNEPANIEKITRVEYTKIVGNFSDDKTIFLLNVKSYAGDDGLWEHGIPDDIEKTGVPDFDRGLVMSAGDGTVPLISALASKIPADYTIELNESHNRLPEEAQLEVFRLLGHQRQFEKVDNVSDSPILAFFFYSPIDAEIISPSGKHIGKIAATGEIVNTIPGAFYSGPTADAEFVTIPDPEEGEYRVLIEGTGTGPYRIEAVRFEEDPSAPDGIRSTPTVSFFGEATPLFRTEEGLAVSADTIEEVASDTTPPVVRITSPTDGGRYENDARIPIRYAATDDQTLTGNIVSTAALDGEEMSTTEIDLALFPLGEHVLAVAARDEAGNEARAEATFESYTTYGSLRENVTRYRALGLITKESVAERIGGMLTILKRINEHISRFPHSLRGIDRMLAAFARVEENIAAETIRMIEREEARGNIASSAAERLIEGLRSLAGV